MKNKKSLIVIALLILVGITSGYVASTYAKYTSTISGRNGTATVAKWAFDTDNASTSLTVALDKTYDASTLVANKIAPGTEGSFDIQVSNANTEVGVNYTIALNSITNLPTNMKFYADRSGSAGAYTYSNEITPGTGTITGTLAPKAAATTKTVYWKWAYETTNGDAADTTDGGSANTLTIGVDITGTQVQPQ